MTIESIPIISREQWLNLRKRDITASSAACLIGQHPYATPYSLWAEKTGRLSEYNEENLAMKRGRLLEPVAIQLLKEERPDWAVTYPLEIYLRDPEVRLGATPDAYAFCREKGGLGIVQIKSVSDHAFRQWRASLNDELQLPLWIAVQAIVEAHLAGAAWARVVALCIGHGCELHVIDVPLHQGVLDNLIKETKNFWKQVDAGIEPRIDWLQDGKTVLDIYRECNGGCVNLLPDLADKLIEYNEAQAMAKLAKGRADNLKPQIIAALGNAAEGKLPGWLVTAKTQKRKEHMVAESVFRKLVVKRLEAA